MSGIVLDSRGAGLQGAEVSLLPAAEMSPPRHAVSRPDGSFRFERVVAGRYTLRAAHPEHALFEAPEPVEVVDEPVVGLEARLEPGATLAGAIRGLRDDELAEVEVVAVSADGLSRRARVSSRQARYEVSGLGPGAWRVRAALPGGERQAETAVVLKRGSEAPEADLEFGDGIALDGRVSLGGEPLTDARASLRSDELAGRRTVGTDRLGRFRIEDLAAGGYRLQVTSRARAVSQSWDLELTESRRLELDIVAREVHGEVVERRDGEPIPEAMVTFERLSSEGDTRPAFAVTTGSDASGAFRLPLLAAGGYRVTVRKEGYELVERRVEIGASRASEPLRLRFALVPSAGLSLEVKTADGLVPEQVVIAVFAPEGHRVLARGVVPGADGRFELGSLPAGRWHALLHGPGTATVQVELEAPGPPPAVVLPPGGDLRVRVPELVLSPRLGRLVLLGPDGGPFEGLDETMERTTLWPVVSGTAEISGVPAGTWTVRVTSAEGRVWIGSATAVPGVVSTVELSGKEDR